MERPRKRRPYKKRITLELVKGELDNIQSEVADCKVALSELQETCKKIEFALLGDSKHKIEGIAAKVDKHEKYIESDKKWKWTIGTILALLILFKDKLMSAVFN